MTAEEIAEAEAQMSAIARECGINETVAIVEPDYFRGQHRHYKQYGYDCVAPNGKRYEICFEVDFNWPSPRKQRFYRRVISYLRECFERFGRQRGVPE